MTRRGESVGGPAYDSIEQLAAEVSDRLSRFAEAQRPEAVARLFTLVAEAVFSPNSFRRAAPSAVIPLSRSSTPLPERLRAGTPAERLPAEAPSPWTLRRVEQSLVSPIGVSVRLSGREFILLEMLSESPGQQASRTTISHLFGYDGLNPSTRSLDSLVYRLRQKARALELVLPLTNIHAAGIRFTEPLRLA